MLKKTYLDNIIAIMPMAGRGQRFKNYGYEIPKPLIKVGKKPMFAKATESFPKNLKWIFISQNASSRASVPTAAARAEASFFRPDRLARGGHVALSS